MIEEAKVAELREVLGEAAVKTDEESRNTYGRDWTFFYEPDASAVVFPKSTDDVVELVRWARKHGQALVPSGGRTGLSGGALASRGEVVVSFEKMNSILACDEVSRTVTCQPGVVTEALCDYVAERGLLYPVTFSAIGSSQIGGNVATNAGGSFVIRYGLTRRWVRGLEVVTGAGDVLRLNEGLVKNATGYDLQQLFIGSEGTLGLITEVTLGLAVPPKQVTTLLFAVESYRSVLALYAELSANFPLRAIEVFDKVALEHVLEHTDLRNPFSQTTDVMLLVEAECSPEDESLFALFERLVEEEIVVDSAMASSQTQAMEFWAYRERIPEIFAQFVPYKNDISVRPSGIPDFVAALQELLQREYHEVTLSVFGHVGDGNLHVNILKPEEMSREDFKSHCEKVNTDLFALVKQFNGSISAEHGVGVVKRDFLNYSRSPEEIELMRGIKKVFDPDGILNPDKIFRLHG